MPEEAPVMMIFFRGLLGFAYLLHEIVDRLQHPLARAALLGAHRVAALHRHRRRGGDLVGDGLLRRAPRPALHAERLQRVEELLRVDALLLQPLGEHLLVGGVQPLAMDGVEERPVHLVEHAERLEAVEDRGVLRPALVEHRRHAPELHVARQLLLPVLDQRLEVVAVDAAVPEELDHLDLALALHRLRRLQLAVVEARLAERGERRKGNCSNQGAADRIHAYCGSLIFTRLASIPFCASIWRTRLISSTLVYGPMRTRYQVPLSGRLAGSTLDSKPRIASRAFWLSASAGFWNEPAWMK